MNVNSSRVAAYILAVLIHQDNDSASLGVIANGNGLKRGLKGVSLEKRCLIGFEMYSLSRHCHSTSQELFDNIVLMLPSISLMG